MNALQEWARRREEVVMDAITGKKSPFDMSIRELAESVGVDTAKPIKIGPLFTDIAIEEVNSQKAIKLLCYSPNGNRRGFLVPLNG